MFLDPRDSILDPRDSILKLFELESRGSSVNLLLSGTVSPGYEMAAALLCVLALPFGLRSAPYIFNSAADMVEWILLNTHNVSVLLH